jgi:hypothetical protein
MLIIDGSFLLAILVDATRGTATAVGSECVPLALAAPVTLVSGEAPSLSTARRPRRQPSTSR